MRLTFGQLKESRIPKVLGICNDDARLAQWVNEAQQRLLNRGRWWGTVVRAYFCIDAGCITLPREVAAIEGATMCESKIQIRNGWYEFLEPDPATCDSCDSEIGLMDRGIVCAYSDIQGTDKKLKVYADDSSDIGKRILLQGYDENKAWIRTLDGSNWVDGEYITIANHAGSLYGLTDSLFTSLTGVQKEATNKHLRLFEYDTGDASERQLAYWQPSEITPAYRRYYIRGFDELTGCCCDDDCDQHTLSALVKLQHVPVEDDTDWLTIGNLDALKHMIRCIQSEENDRLDTALVFEKKAIAELNHELRTHTGDKTHVQIAVDGIGTARLKYTMSNFI